MRKTIFTGAGVAIVTPMFPDGSINYEKFAELIEEQIANKTDAIVVVGTTGEASTMTDEEHIEMIRFCVEKVAKRVPVIAGTGSNDTGYAVELTKEAEKVGADATLQVTPYYNKTSQRGLVAHFNTIADSVNIPTILYNVPSRTGCNILPATVAKLAEHENIAAIKEATGNISQVAEVAQLCGDNIDIYSGNDDQIVPVLSLGGKGVISVLSNLLPKETSLMCKKFFEGDVKGSLELQLKYLPLINALFSEVNPIPVKAAMAAMGYGENYLRLPLTPMEKAHEDVMFDLMKKESLI